MQELKLLDDDANVFKAVGPVLVRQDLMEARTNVTNRLDYIKKDIERLDNQIKGVESKMLDREREVSRGYDSTHKLFGQMHPTSTHESILSRGQEMFVTVLFKGLDERCL